MGAECRRERLDLRRIGREVLAEVDDTGEATVELAQQPVRGGPAEEPRPEDATDQPGDVGVGHPFTAPETRPPERRRCTRMKKIMTGIVMIVDAAMTEPQSLEFSPKNCLRPMATV